MPVAVGQVGRFVRVGRDVEQLELRALNVLADRLVAVGRVLSLGPLRLPTAGGPQVRGERIGQRMGDVPDQFVLRRPGPLASDSTSGSRETCAKRRSFRGAVRRDWPSSATTTCRDSESNVLVAVSVLLERFASLASKTCPDRAVLGRVGCVIKSAGEVQQRGRDVDVADQRLGLDAALRSW